MIVILIIDFSAFNLDLLSEEALFFQIHFSYRDLLEFSASTSIHQRHSSFLLTEICESTVTSNPRFMWRFTSRCTMKTSGNLKLSDAFRGYKQIEVEHLVVLLQKPLSSGNLQVLKSLSVIDRCPLLGGKLKKTVTFGTERSVRYSRHFRCLGCPLLGCFTIGMPTIGKF